MAKITLVIIERVELGIIGGNLRFKYGQDLVLFRDRPRPHIEVLWPLYRSHQ